MSQSSPMRSFDPRKVGELECRMWAARHRREWWPPLRAAVALVRHSFGLSRPATRDGAWLAPRANQLWAPPAGDPDGARRHMRRVLGLVARAHGERIDVVGVALVRSHAALLAAVHR